MTPTTNARLHCKYLAAGLALAALFASVVPASACMDGMMRTMTFMKHPQAKKVFVAATRSTKVVLPRSGNRQAHMLSLIRTKRTVAALQARYQSAAVSRDQSPNISVLLAEEAFSITLSDVAEPRKSTAAYTGIDIYSTASAFKSMLQGRLSWEEAVAEKLVVLAGPTDRQSAIADRMRGVLKPVD